MFQLGQAEDPDDITFIITLGHSVYEGIPIVDWYLVSREYLLDLSLF
jgi:hypothetical protein